MPARRPALPRPTNPVGSLKLAQQREYLTTGRARTLRERRRGYPAILGQQQLESLAGDRLRSPSLPATGRLRHAGGTLPRRTRPLCRSPRDRPALHRTIHFAPVNRSSSNGGTPARALDGLGVTSGERGARGSQSVDLLVQIDTLASIESMIAWVVVIVVDRTRPIGTSSLRVQCERIAAVRAGWDGSWELHVVRVGSGRSPDIAT